MARLNGFANERFALYDKPAEGGDQCPFGKTRLLPLCQHEQLEAEIHFENLPNGKRNPRWPQPRDF
jgi:hypothetical protein